MASSLPLASGQPAPLRLLSLDGGGVRGLSSLIILKYLMKRLNPQKPPKPCEYFDLIGGTSTGGLIAIMLGRLQMDIDSCITAYLDLSSVAFQRKTHKTNIYRRGNDAYHVKGAYSSEGLEKAVKEIVKSVEGDQEAKLASSNRCKIFVCAFTKAGNTPVLIRSYTHDTAVESLSTSGCTIWQAARATSAAATFFDPIKIGRQEYVDGATGLNNPVEYVFEEARSIWPNAMTRIQCIVSIGTGVPDLKDFGENMKEVIKTLKAISTETEETERRFFTNRRQFGLGDRYFRFNVQQGLINVEMDEHEKIDKIESATERYLGLPVMKEKADGFVAARPPNALLPLTREAKNSLLRWLKFVDSSALHNDMRQKHTKGTGAWFVEAHFDDWKTSPHSFLWLYGKAGCGKSVLCSNIIDQIDGQHLGSLAYFYFTFRRHERQDLRNLIHSLLTKLVRSLVREDKQQPHLYHMPRAYQELYDKYFLESEPKIEDLQETFLRVLAESKATYIVIDALDECPLIKDRYEILKFLAEVSSTSSSTHILVTSRREEDIQDTINEISLSAKVTDVPIQNSQVDYDIRRYVKSCLADNIQFKRWVEDVKAEVTDYLVSNASGVFRWVECQLVTLGPKKRKMDVLETLKHLPKDLDETYARMLAHIDSIGYRKEARAVLQWLAFSNRPLALGEAAEAAVFDQEKGESTPEAYPVSFDPQYRFPEAVDIQNVLSQLVIVSENGQISFAHFSVKEYLICDRVEPAYRIEKHLAHRFILECCLVYMQSYFSLPTRPRAKQDGESFPLLYYSCQYWPDHARETFAAKIQTQHTDKLVRTLFQRSETSFISSLKISSSVPRAIHRLYRSETVFASPAWFLAYHNLEYILQLLRNASEVMYLGIQLKFDGLVALHVAARKGYDAVASLLLDTGAEIEAKDENEQTALHLASSTGHDYLVRLLLKRGANIKARNLDERVALHIAAMEGQEAVVEILASQMQKEDLEIRDFYGLTALHLAVRFAEWRGASGESITKKLLEYGASPEVQSYSGKTAVQDVTDYSQVQILTLLESFGGTVRSHASTRSNDIYFNEAWKTIRASVLKSIWNRGKKGDIQTFMATHTAVHDYCTFRGSPRQGSRLLGGELYAGIDRHIQSILEDIQGAICRRNRDEILRIYIREWNHYFKAATSISPMFRYLDRHWIQQERNGGKKNIYLILDLFFLRWKESVADQEQGIIPLIIELLKKQRNGEAVDMTQVKAVLYSFQAMGWTALDWAAENLHEAEVRMLLEHTANIDARDGIRQTPLHWAARGGDKAMVQLLLECRVDVAANDSNGWTALHSAAENGHETVLLLLLENGADIDAKESHGRTSLHLAAQYGHKAVVWLLFENGADIDAKESDGQTSLHLAAQYGHEAVVRSLLEKGADINAKESHGRMALHVAARSGHRAVVLLLLEKGADIDAKESDGWTALHLAAQYGHEAVVRSLLEKGADIEAKESDGRTALHKATESGHGFVVWILLENGADTSAKDSTGQTALHRAAGFGNKPLIQLLAAVTPNS